VAVCKMGVNPYPSGAISAEDSEMSKRPSIAGKGSTMRDLVPQLQAPTATNPVAWFWKGAALRHASDILWDRFWSTWKEGVDSHIVGDAEFSPEQRLDLKLAAVWRMLSGLAIEALTKGIILARNRNRWTEVTKSHDLKKLCAVAGIDPDSREKPILKVLSEAVKWEGRYPVPKMDCDMNVFFPPGRGDLLLVNALFERVAKEYKSVLLPTGKPDVAP